MSPGGRKECCSRPSTETPSSCQQLSASHECNACPSRPEGIITNNVNKSLSELHKSNSCFSHTYTLIISCGVIYAAILGTPIKAHLCLRFGAVLLEAGLCGSEELELSDHVGLVEVALCTCHNTHTHMERGMKGGRREGGREGGREQKKKKKPSTIECTCTYASYLIFWSAILEKSTGRLLHSAHTHRCIHSVHTHRCIQYLC